MTPPFRPAAAAMGAAALAVLLAPAPLAAQDDAGESGYIAALRACQAEAGADARLACYDAAVTAILAASAEGEVQVVDREEVRRTRARLFGFALPDLGIFGRRGGSQAEAEAEELTRLVTTIAAVRQGRGTLVLTTAEGAQWQLDEVPARLIRPRVGQSLEIRSGAFSSYFLRIDGQNGVKGRRLR